MIVTQFPVSFHIYWMSYPKLPDRESGGGNLETDDGNISVLDFI